MSGEQGSWVKSKLVRFMFIYWAVIVVLTYSVEWLGRHGPAIQVVFSVFGVGILLYVALRVAAWRRRNRMW